MSTPSQEQKKRSASDIFVAFEYQWDYFVLTLLQKGVDDTTSISFELLDDVAVQGDEGVVLCQVKHSVRKNKAEQTINLSNRDIDLWKTISIWIKLIEECTGKDLAEYIANTEFHLITNKKIADNKFVIALNKFKDREDLNEFRNSLAEISNSGERDSKLSGIISAFIGKPYLEQFLGKIRIITKSDCLQNDIFDALHNRAFLPMTKVKSVYNTLMTELRDAVKLDIKNRKIIKFTGKTFADRFQSVFETGREKLYFRVDYDYGSFDGDPRQLLFIQQLDVIKDLPAQEGARLDKIVQYAKEWFQFKNNLQDYWDNGTLITEDIMKLSADVRSSWSSNHTSAYRRLDLNSPEEELCDAGCLVIDTMRNKEFTLGNTPLGQMLSNGCIYYYSNSPTNVIQDLPYIGWHINWESKFKNK